MTSSVFHAPGYEVRQLGADAIEDVLSFLSRDIVQNLFMLCWADNYGVVSPSRPELFHFSGVYQHEELVGVALIVARRLVLLDVLDRGAAASLGEWYGARSYVFEHIVSAAMGVESFWQAYRRFGFKARLIRSQKLYVLDRETWLEKGERLESSLRLAFPDDLDAVFLASARMHAEETLEDPLDRDARHFRRHVEHRIQSDRTWVWFNEHRRLLFKADVSAQGRFGAQVSGVYTPPALRGQGLATRGMHDVCFHLFERGLPRVILYVNEENPAAIRVYEKVGFEEYSDYQTVFVAI